MINNVFNEIFIEQSSVMVFNDQPIVRKQKSYTNKRWYQIYAFFKMFSENGDWIWVSYSFFFTHTVYSNFMSKVIYRSYISHLFEE